MNFELSEEQQMLKRTARDFFEKECPESLVRQLEEDEKGYSPELWRKIADLGWLGFIYPEEYGGTGGSILDMAILYEEMGRALFPSPHLSTVVLGGLTILNAGSEEQKADLLPKIAKGDLILALALTEPDSLQDGKGWEPEGIRVQAVAQGDDYVINGTKLFVQDAKAADNLLCVTRTADGAKPEDGVSLFLVDINSPGISYNVLRTTASDKRNWEVVFDNVRVPKRNMVGELNGSWAHLAKTMQVGAALLSAQMVGSGEVTMEAAVDYAKTRYQFDMPIGIHNWIQEYCIQAFADVQGTRNLVYEAAWMLSEGIPCDMEVSMAKAQAGQAIPDCNWQSMQVLAGVGFTSQEGILPLHTKRNRLNKYYLGDPDHHMEKVAEHIEEQWEAPEKPKGKPLGIFDVPEDQQEPVWDVWADAIKRKGKLW